MDVPRTLLVTNDYPPRVGGIQRTLESLVRRFPPDRVAVLCPDADDTAGVDGAAPYRVFRQPERFLWPTPGVGRRLHDAVRSFGADVVLFGAVYPLALLGPSLAEAGTPYLAAAHGFEYWLDLAGNARARAAGHLPSGTGAGDVQRVHRSGRPDGRPGRGAGLGDVPGRGRGGVPAGPAVRGSHRSARRRGPTARRLREPARRARDRTC